MRFPGCCCRRPFRSVCTRLAVQEQEQRGAC
jgi:hypothetical protein